MLIVLFNTIFRLSRLYMLNRTDPVHPEKMSGQRLFSYQIESVNFQLTLLICINFASIISINKYFI